jgi:hypothetical protein
MPKITEQDLKKQKTVRSLSGIDKAEVMERINKDLRRTTEAFLPQSKYSITLSAFTRGELISLQSLIRREELYREETYKIIYKHIVETSLGQLTLEEFLVNTSFLDLDTLAYLMYSATFKDRGTYTFNCLNPDCNKPIDIQLNNSSLIKINNPDLYENMRKEALKEEIDLDSLRKKEHFFLNKGTHLRLADSGYYITLKEPSLAEDAWTLRHSKDDKLEGDEGLLSALECIKEIRIPLGDSNEYLVIDDKGEMLKYIYQLSFSDQKELIDEAEEIMYGGAINYKIDEVKCPHCGEVYKDLPISMSNVLFYLIYTEV